MPAISIPEQASGARWTISTKTVPPTTKIPRPSTAPATTRKRGSGGGRYAMSLLAHHLSAGCWPIRRSRSRWPRCRTAILSTLQSRHRRRHDPEDGRRQRLRARHGHLQRAGRAAVGARLRGSTASPSPARWCGPSSMPMPGWPSPVRWGWACSRRPKRWAGTRSGGGCYVEARGSCSPGPSWPAVAASRKRSSANRNIGPGTMADITSDTRVLGGTPRPPSMPSSASRTTASRRVPWIPAANDAVEKAAAECPHADGAA